MAPHRRRSFQPLRIDWSKSDFVKAVRKKLSASPSVWDKSLQTMGVDILQTTVSGVRVKSVMLRNPMPQTTTRKSDHAI
eukprot:3339434-Amphidinium_carterae.1